MLLAAEAERLDDTPIGRRALLASLTAEPSLQHDLATGADGVSNAAFSSNGRIVAAQTTDNRVVFWSLPTGHRMPIQVNVKDATGLGPMQFLDHDNLFAIQRYGNTSTNIAYSVEVRSMRTGAVIRRSDMSDGWTSSANAPFIADSAGKILRVFNADTGQIVRTLPSSGENQPAVALSPDGTILAAAHVDQVEGSRTYAEVIDVWDVANGTWVSGCRIDAGDQFNGAFVQPPLEPIILNLTVDDDASTVRTALSGGTRAVVGNCDLVDPGDPDVRDVEIPTVPTAPVAAVSDDEQTIATRDTQNGTVRLFDTSGKQVAPELRANTAFPGNYIGVQFSPDGRLVIPTDAADGDVKLWSISNSRPALANDVEQLLGTRVLATSTDGQVLVVSKDNATSFVDRSTGASLARLPAVPDAVAVSADDSIAVAAVNATSGSQSATGSLTVVDLRTHMQREVRIAEPACARQVGAVALARGHDRLFAVCGGPDYVVTELDISGAATRPVASSKFTMAGAEQQIAVSPDGLFVVAGGFVHFGSGFQLFEVRGAQLRPLTSESVIWGLSAAAFAPDGRTFATVFGNGRTQLWRIVSSGAVPTELNTPGAEHDAVAFSADGSELAIGGCPSTDIWSLDPVTQIGSLKSGAGCADQLAFSEGARSLLSIGSSTIRTSSTSANTTEWDVDPRNWVQDACLIVGRNLTKREWSEFLPNASYRKTCPSEPS